MACTWQVYDYLVFIFMMLALQFFIVEFECVQAKALAEKNQWDLQTQREQAERHVSNSSKRDALKKPMEEERRK